MKKQRMKQRVCAALLTLCMALALVPVLPAETVLAYRGYQSGIDLDEYQTSGSTAMHYDVADMSAWADISNSDTWHYQPEDAWQVNVFNIYFEQRKIKITYKITNVTGNVKPEDCHVWFEDDGKPTAVQFDSDWTCSTAPLILEGGGSIKAYFYMTPSQGSCSFDIQATAAETNEVAVFPDSIQGDGIVSIDWEGGESAIVAGKECKYTINIASGYSYSDWDNSWTSCTGQTVGIQGRSGTYLPRVPGLYTAKICYTDASGKRAASRLSFSVYPGTPDVKGIVAKGTHNKLVVSMASKTEDLGSSPMLQIYKNGEWVDVVASSGKENGYTATGLKGNTKYKFRLVGCEPASEMTGGKELRGTPSAAVTVTTASKEKPQIQSVKIVSAKNEYHPAFETKPYWDSSGTWHPAQKVAASWTANVTVKVTLKKAVPGSKRLAIELVSGGRSSTAAVTGNGKKTITATVVLDGKISSGKASVRVQSFADKKGRIYGPKSAKKTVSFKAK